MMVSIVCSAQHVDTVVPGSPEFLAEPLTPKTPADQKISDVAFTSIRHSSVEGEVSPRRQKRIVCLSGEQQDEGVIKRFKSSSPVDDQESHFVRQKKKLLREKITLWRDGYSPAPSFVASWIPGMKAIVRKQSLSVVDKFEDSLDRVSSKAKLVSVLAKNKQIMTENMFCMNAATEKKMKEACAFIDQELAEIGPVAESPRPEIVVKTEKTVDSSDPLHAEKTSVLEQLKTWKAEFHPKPPSVFAGFSGVVDSVQGSAHRLFQDLFKDIRKAPTKEKLVKIFEESRELISDYKIFVDGNTVAQLDQACAILQKEQVACPATSK